jgi:FlaA1/EpsC-like NDP-sugar epimerase
MPVTFSWLCLLSLGGARILVRALIGKMTTSHKESVIIYGVGVMGRKLATALNVGSEYFVNSFIDDDTTKHGSIILCIRICDF